MTSKEIIQQLKSLSDPKNIEGMKRFACGGAKTLGISVLVLRKMAKEINKSNKVIIIKHKLAQELWQSGYHEARILASMIDEPSLVTEKRMDAWIADFDSWDVCDQVCMNLFDKTKFAFDKAIEWSSRQETFQKRSGFALMAVLAWHQKNNNLPDEKFLQFLPIIIREATDERNFVKKAVNWALRQIGKSRPSLRQPALDTAREIIKKYPNSKSARWIANDAIRELKGESNE